ncbi:Cytoplasmic dynein 2 light intermediate chain 1 [Rhizophlyctis rosea]|uniref:Cytoplasmic dynein 2 light intermediate chain 1 n=1 Tax=Rhizophlyctis rosea TaxID=64517 RepID=A0AAD5SH80_9FUNG|nr:Cytoplasmic dynein 2 light intermediate chain 1 [Rhizophlyctis rosea]
MGALDSSAPDRGSANNLNHNISDERELARSSIRKDIWTLVKEAKEREKKNVESVESTMYVVGSKHSGKTSIVFRFLDREEAPTPTVGLEYTFGRRTRGVNAVKDVTHIWELAGGTYLSDLIDIPITETNIHTCTFIVTLDLSDPQSLIPSLDHFLSKISSRTTAILDSLESRGSKRPKALRAYAWKKFGPDHPDKNALTPLAVPVVLVGTKWDVFRDLESEKRKVICKALRYAAHIHGASLVFTSQKDENLVAKTRQILSHHAFRTSPPKSIQIDHSKPVLVLAGQDSLSQIGPPTVYDSTATVVGKQQVATWRQWRSEVERVVGSTGNQQQVPERVDVQLQPQPLVDNVRAQKDEDLERLRRANERKAKEKDFLAALTGGGDKAGSKKTGKSYSRSRAANMGVAVS